MCRSYNTFQANILKKDFNGNSVPPRISYYNTLKLKGHPHDLKTTILQLRYFLWSTKIWILVVNLNKYTELTFLCYEYRARVYGKPKGSIFYPVCN